MKPYLLLILVILLSCKRTEQVITSDIKAPYTKQPIVLSDTLSSSSLHLDRLALSELRLLRNEIYARRGYTFNSKDLIEHFSEYDWYSPKYNDIEINAYLSEIDRGNIKEIQKAEKKVRERLIKEERYKSFTFSDFLNRIPEIELPAKCCDWVFKDDVDYQMLEANKKELFEKYKEYWPTFGKITLEDSLVALGYHHASDIYVYTVFNIVDEFGNIMSEVGLPMNYRSSEDEYDFADTTFRDVEIKYFKESVITEDLDVIVSSWEVKSTYKRPDILIKSISSDTIVSIEKFY